jgi:hypothetical protein
MLFDKCRGEMWASIEAQQGVTYRSHILEVVGIFCWGLLQGGAVNLREMWA